LIFFAVTGEAFIVAEVFAAMVGVAFLPARNGNATAIAMFFVFISFSLCPQNMARLFCSRTDGLLTFGA
jgi:hypothetical protein